MDRICEIAAKRSQKTFNNQGLLNINQKMENYFGERGVFNVKFADNIDNYDKELAKLQRAHKAYPKI